MVDSINSPATSTTISSTRLGTGITSGISSPSPAEKDPLTLELNPVNSAIATSNSSTSPAVTLLVSKESQEKATQDLAIAKLVRKANTVKEPYNQEKVEQFKKLAQDPQALSQYLESIDTDAIATSILSNAEGKLFS
jgi:hypothetical protein